MFVIKTKETRKIEETVFEMALWMELAIEGRKIDAIKELRSQIQERRRTSETFAGSGAVDSTYVMGLLEAKLVIENFLSCIRIETRDL